MAALLGALDNVPAYPEKARPLFNSPHSFQALIQEIDRCLEHQLPGYRHFLHSVYVLESPGRVDKLRSQVIYQQWDLMPTTRCSSESIASFFDTDFSDGLIVVLCLQDWPAQSTGQSSEFVSAQLIAAPAFTRQHSLPVTAGITRMMPLEPGELMNELTMLFDYVQPDKQCLKYVWLLEEAENTAAVIMQYATRHQWLLPEKRPLYSIDFSFGPPGEMALPLSLAMLAEAANKTGEDQLLVHHTPQQTGTLCLITRELYL